MKFIKIVTNHTPEQIDVLSASMSFIQKERIACIYKQMGYVQFENENGYVCMFASINSNYISELLDMYVSMSVNFRYEDLTKDALYRKIDAEGYGLVPDKVSQLFYILNKFIDENIDVNTILEKVFEMGEGSLTDKDLLILKAF